MATIQKTIIKKPLPLFLFPSPFLHEQIIHRKYEWLKHTHVFGAIFTSLTIYIYMCVCAITVTFTTTCAFYLTPNDKKKLFCFLKDARMDLFNSCIGQYHIHLSICLRKLASVSFWRLLPRHIKSVGHSFLRTNLENHYCLLFALFQREKKYSDFDPRRLKKCF